MLPETNHDGTSPEHLPSSKQQSDLFKPADEQFDFYITLAHLWDTEDLRCPEHLTIYEDKYKQPDEKRAVQ
jgi:hypothetical protein